MKKLATLMDDSIASLIAIGKDRTVVVTLNSDALDSLAKIAEHRGYAATATSDKARDAHREEVRSYAVDVVNALLRANPELK